MQKLYLWKVTQRLEFKPDKVFVREEIGIVRACSQDEARELLEKLVCTVYTTNVVVTEIPDKISVYSFGYTDTKL